MIYVCFAPESGHSPDDLDPRDKPPDSRNRPLRCQVPARTVSPAYGVPARNEAKEKPRTGRSERGQCAHVSSYRSARSTSWENDKSADLLSPSLRRSYPWSTARTRKAPRWFGGRGQWRRGDRLLCLLISIPTIAPPSGVKRQRKKASPERGQLPVKAAAMSGSSSPGRQHPYPSRLAPRCASRYAAWIEMG